MKFCVLLSSTKRPMEAKLLFVEASKILTSVSNTGEPSYNAFSGPLSARESSLSHDGGFDIADKAINASHVGVAPQSLLKNLSIALDDESGTDHIVVDLMEDMECLARMCLARVSLSLQHSRADMDRRGSGAG